jgi:two-component system nitrogen regulation response regulator GlnG
MQNQPADRTTESPLLPRKRADAPRALVKAVTTLASHLVSTRPGAVYREMLALVEAPLLAHVLTLTGGNQVRAARLLGVNRNTLYKRGRQLGLLPPSGGERRSESSLSNSAG